MSTVLTDIGRREGGYIISEAGGATGMRSRDRGTLKAGAVGLSGMVLAQLTADKKLVPMAATAADPDTGSATAYAVLFTSADASTADQPVVFHARDCEVNDRELVWPAGISAPNKAAAITALAAKGIIVRTK
ncbi:head decoration protein [Neorhizobium sp. T786]|uniref:head decoration protein n=1 Tax=Pseudorhizobium xiangyangii TaxID=2883104 RepID=UPI001CFF775F|nr:head decoration protein [Neorhizobium xiangyangii]MCB5201714.1 head decoration protein [Neorhizobium xiangyangii]